MSQTEQILRYLKRGFPLTPLLALDRFACLRLSPRILELRKQGHSIDSKLVRFGRKRIAVYRIAK